MHAGSSLLDDVEAERLAGNTVRTLPT